MKIHSGWEWKLIEGKHTYFPVRIPRGISGHFSESLHCSVCRSGNREHNSCYALKLWEPYTTLVWRRRSEVNYVDSSICYLGIWVGWISSCDQPNRTAVNITRMSPLIYLVSTRVTICSVARVSSIAQLEVAIFLVLYTML